MASNEPIKWPLAVEPRGGWTLDFGFLHEVKRVVQDMEGINPVEEDIEAILIAAASLYNTKIEGAQHGI